MPSKLRKSKQIQNEWKFERNSNSQTVDLFVSKLILYMNYSTSFIDEVMATNLFSAKIKREYL